MTSGQVFPSLTSSTKTTKGIEQLSASSVTSAVLSAGTSPAHWTLIGAGFDAVGLILSPIVLVCVTNIWFPQSSATLYVLVMTSVQVFPTLTSPTKATTGTEQLSASSVTTTI